MSLVKKNVFALKKTCLHIVKIISHANQKRNSADNYENGKCAYILNLLQSTLRWLEDKNILRLLFVNC